jgi:hypothetical protein
VHVLARKLRRADVLKFFEKLPPCLVGMGSMRRCPYWAREITALGHGHEVRLIPPTNVYAVPFWGKYNPGEPVSGRNSLLTGKREHPREPHRGAEGKVRRAIHALKELGKELKKAAKDFRRMTLLRHSHRLSNIDAHRDSKDMQA